MPKTMSQSKSCSHVGSSQHSLFGVKKSSSFEFKKDINSLRIAFHDALRKARVSVSMSPVDNTVTIHIAKEQHVKTNQGEIQNYMKQYNEELINNSNSELDVPLFKNRKFVFNLNVFKEAGFTVADIKDFANYIITGKHLERKPGLHAILLSALETSEFSSYITSRTGNNIELNFFGRDEVLGKFLMCLQKYNRQQESHSPSRINLRNAMKHDREQRIKAFTFNVSCLEASGMTAGGQELQALISALEEPTRNLRASI